MVVWRVSRVRVRASVWHGTNTRFATVKVLQRRKTPARTTKGEGYLFHLRLLGQTDIDRRKNIGWFSQIPKGDATRQSRSPRSADEWTRDPTSKSCEKFGKKTNSWPLLRPILYGFEDPWYQDTKSILRKNSARFRKRGFISWMDE